jgi:hypothetical protein
MLTNGVRYSPGGALPTTPHDQAVGLGSGTRMPQAGPVAALAARPTQRAGDGTAAPRAALGKLTQGLGQKLESARVQTHVLNLVHSGGLNLRGNYPASQLAKAVDLAATGLANLTRDFRV